MNLIKLKKIKLRHIVEIILVAIVFLITVVNTNKGLDFTDTGYFLSSYKFGLGNILYNPESILTTYLGGILLFLTSELGILGIRIAGCALTLLTCLIIYKLLITYVDKIAALTGLVIAVTLSKYLSSFIIGYNQFSLLFISLLIFFLWKGITKNKKILVSIAGLITGALVFIRIPNVLEASLGLSFIYYGVINKDFLKYFKQLILYISGFFAAIILMLCFQSIRYGLNVYFFKLQKSIFSIQTDHNSHSFINIITKIFNGYKSGMMQILIIVIFVSIAILLIYLLRNRISDRNRNIFLGVITLIVFIVYIIYFNFDIKISEYMIICVIVLTSAYVLLFKNNFKNEEKLLYFMSTISMFVYPIGSNVGLAILYVNLFIQIPLLIHFLLQFKKPFFYYGRELNYKNLLCVPVIIVVISLAFFNSLYTDLTAIYRDKNASNLNYKIDNEYVYTNQLRAKEVNKVLAEVKKYDMTKRKLLLYGSIPLFCYLLNKEPYLTNPWCGLDIYSMDTMRYDMCANENNNELRPIIIIANQNIRCSNWPILSDESFLRNRETDKKYLIIADFIKNNKYKVIYNSNVFTVYS